MVLPPWNEHDPHFATNVFEAFTYTFSKGYHHMDAVVVVVIIIAVIDVLAGVVILGLNDAVSVIDVNVESMKVPNGIVTP